MTDRSQHPPVTFEAARQIVASARRGSSRPGHYMVAAYGYESPRHWQIIDGSRDLLIDNDYAFQPVGEGPVLVDKITGELIELPSLYNFAYLNTFTPVGDVPSDEE
ncbi:hypothetical protein AL755_20135 [Arthrobacter sp. ERGS1:01]|uniref:hypothetical protein n=1 Tax=Arthrobacter sp. ERGS1:01 TaxID=1704044 RepID=UPI0006B650E3|nr:hypothetical protein [Arthrobacter sp. ERGS1:01]ALE07250.1 hypothetical protein AL755_20135 [Arthrobacter sp. ERGS1:01]